MPVVLAPSEVLLLRARVGPLRIVRTGVPREERLEVFRLELPQGIPGFVTGV
jgi:hypothetical protein